MGHTPIGRQITNITGSWNKNAGIFTVRHICSKNVRIWVYLPLKGDCNRFFSAHLMNAERFSIIVSMVVGLIASS